MVHGYNVGGVKSLPFFELNSVMRAELGTSMKHSCYGAYIAKLPINAPLAFF